jgi:hypothetical protein
VELEEYGSSSLVKVGVFHFFVGDVSQMLWYTTAMSISNSCWNSIG